MANQPLFSDFIEHLFPRLINRQNLNIKYTFCLGGLALTCFLITIFSGLLLLFYYLPSPKQAYASIVFLEQNVFAGRFLRSLHRLSAEAMLIFVFLHSLRVIWTGACTRPRQLNWSIGCILLLASLATAYTGYLLPMDELGFWAARTGIELLKSLPLGNGLSCFLAPDGLNGPLSLLRFYVLHVLVLPLLIAICCFLHFYQIRKNQGILPYL